MTTIATKQIRVSVRAADELERRAEAERTSVREVVDRMVATPRGPQENSL